jgi:hypothetical protein
MTYPAICFASIGNAILYRNRENFELSRLLTCGRDRQFKALFGTTAQVCVTLWELMSPETSMPKNARPKHLLWALLLLKVYGTETVLSSLVGGTTEKTYRKWAWCFIEGIAKLESSVVSWFIPMH